MMVASRVAMVAFRVAFGCIRFSCVYILMLKIIESECPVNCPHSVCRCVFVRKAVTDLHKYPLVKCSGALMHFVTHCCKRMLKC